MVEIIVNNWQLFALAIASVIALYFIIKEPKRVKEWLIWACAEAELALGSGTGEMKLRMVYDMFMTQFPLISKIITFSLFKRWTEEALNTFKKWLENEAFEQSFFNKNK